MTLTFAKISPWIAEVLPSNRTRGGKVLLDNGGDFIRAIILERTSDPQAFFLNVIVDTLFDPKDFLAFTLGFRSETPTGSDYWEKSDPDLKQNIQQAVLRDAPPFFAATDGHDKIIRALEADYPSGSSPRRWYYVGCCHARQGRLREANRCWNLVFDKTTAEVPWQNELRGWAGELLAHFEKSDAAGQAKLDELVAQSRSLLKL
jgi:hypothetical protein